MSLSVSRMQAEGNLVPSGVSWRSSSQRSWQNTACPGGIRSKLAAQRCPHLSPSICPARPPARAGLSCSIASKLTGCIGSISHPHEVHLPHFFKLPYHLKNVDCVVSPSTGTGLRSFARTKVESAGQSGLSLLELRLSHHLIVLNYLICTFDKLKSVSSEPINITDVVFDGVEVRVFEPPAKQDEPLKRSVVYIHGGGWALASARTSLYNNLCRIMAESLNAVVVSIEYRLVPEVCFPEQFHDALRATKHFLQPDVLAEYSVDPNRIAISGDSAGGNLAAAVCQQLSKDELLIVRPKLQALIYPVLQAFDFNTPSYQQNMNMPVLPRYVMINYWIDYFNGNYDLAHSLLINNHTALDVHQALTFRGRLNWTSLLPSSFKKNYKPVVQTTGNAEIIQEIPALLDVRAVPLLAENETLQLQPKTYILTCENDVLRDDGVMYAKRLENAGVEVTLDHFDDCFHGCMIFTIWPTDFSAGVQTRNSYIKWLDENL